MSVKEQKYRKDSEEMSYLLLGMAIALELLGTSILKYTHGFTKLYPTLGCIALYTACFFCLSKAIMKLNLGVAYATWCGVGIVVAALISVFIYKQDMTPLGVVGILLIVVGCVILNLFGSAH